MGSKSFSFSSLHIMIRNSPACSRKELFSTFLMISPLSGVSRIFLLISSLVKGKTVVPILLSLRETFFINVKDTLVSKSVIEHTIICTCRSDGLGGTSTSNARRIRRRSISITPEIGDDIVR